MFRLLNNKFLYDIPDSNGPAASGDGLSKDDVIDFLNVDEVEEKDEPLKLTDDKKTDKPAKDKSTKTADADDAKDDNDDDDTDEEDDELKGLEEELEDPTEEQLELTTPVRRREILAKYPNLFKDFPYLEKAYYREQQFTEITPTIEDAREAVEARENLQRFEADLMQGNISTILTAVKDQDANGFYRIVDELLPNLARVDEGAYHHLMGNMAKHTIMAMLKEAKQSNNEVLQSAAQILNQFVFGTSDWVPPQRLSKDTKTEPDSRESELERRERALATERFEDARANLNGRINNVLKSTIEQNIDPKGSMTDYVRRNASREVHEQLNTLIVQDRRFKILTDKLWEAAFKSNFSKESVDRIKTAYLSKSRALLPSVIKKARNEALKGMGKRVKEEELGNEETQTSRRTERSRSNDRSDKTSNKSDLRGVRTLDFLNR